MSKADVEAVFGPQWVQDEVASLREYRKAAEAAIVALRNKLRAADPSLPHVYDGRAWEPIERAWMKSDRTEE